MAQLFLVSMVVVRDLASNVNLLAPAPAATNHNGNLTVNATLMGFCVRQQNRAADESLINGNLPGGVYTTRSPQHHRLHHDLQIQQRQQLLQAQSDHLLSADQRHPHHHHGDQLSVAHHLHHSPANLNVRINGLKSGPPACSCLLHVVLLQVAPCRS